ncbi:hypothetical protein IFM89_018138 [Coptis chinensis]|uniref:Carbohydrate kinase PfkB domain-containing protein n=1 Tax=Coptis chinensis TaxID=261450 RepID=A0A835HX05_9MAGN|nr:hypothetical protein IFM89_018138 [Coptis chinensis]
MNRCQACLGETQSTLFIEGKEAIRQPIIVATEVIDTIGAGDTFTASFVVALVEGKSKEECMRFAGTALFFCSVSFFCFDLIRVFTKLL